MNREIQGEPMPEHLFVEYPDGRRSRLMGFVCYPGETIEAALQRVMQQAGGVAIVFVPAKVSP